METNLSAVNTSVLNPEDDVSLAGNVDAVCVGLVDGAATLGQDGDEVLHLLGLDLLFTGWISSCRSLHR